VNGHALVVGGSGMLAGLSRRLLQTHASVSVLARHEAAIRAIAPAVHPLVCDYNDEIAVATALAADKATHNAPDLVVAWVHGRAPVLRRRLAEAVAPGGRFLQVLGSAHGNPAHPERLVEMAMAAAGLLIVYQAVVLGFVVEPGGTRWNSPAEISQGVAAAVDSGRALSVVGRLEPWSARPSGGAPFPP
jgi:NAD(P)-dependent dehydrogenase (short-subunit alcohol dehydrogenase family)